MRFTVCESTTPPIKELIKENYIPWYCDVDASTEWYTYGSGLGSFSLPLIAVIDPITPNTFLNRTTGFQSSADFYSRLWEQSVSDVDHSGTSSIEDIILILQVMAGMTTSKPVYADGDINGDNRLGLAEAVSVLDSLAQ